LELACRFFALGKALVRKKPLLAIDARELGEVKAGDAFTDV
jgi:hypothetical protein